MIAGESGDGRLVGPVEGLAVAPKFMDVTLPAGATFREPVPRGHTAFAYVDQGEVRFGPEQTRASAPALVIFGDGDLVEAAAGSERGPVPAGRRAAAARADRALGPVRHEHARGDRADARRTAQRPLHPRGAARRMKSPTARNMRLLAQHPLDGFGNCGEGMAIQLDARPSGGCCGSPTSRRRRT